MIFVAIVMAIEFLILFLSHFSLFAVDISRSLVLAVCAVKSVLSVAVAIAVILAVVVVVVVSTSHATSQCHKRLVVNVVSPTFD